MLRKENAYDQILERVSAKYGGRYLVPLLKALAADFSEFEAGHKDGLRQGLCGLTYEMAERVTAGSGQELRRGDLLDADINLDLTAKYIKLLYCGLSNPDMFDVVFNLFQHMGFAERPARRMVDSVWAKYKEYSQSSNQPDGCSPMESMEMQL